MRKRSIRSLFIFTLLPPWTVVPAPQPASTPEGKETFLAVYKPGPAFLAAKPLKEQPLKEHGRYIICLHAQGILKFAGPFSDDAGGASVFEAANESAAKAIVPADPAVVSKVFVVDLHRWDLSTGSA